MDATMGSPELAAKIGQVLVVPMHQKDDGAQQLTELSIEYLLGVGTFAGVYVASDKVTGERYALKVTFKSISEQRQHQTKETTPELSYPSPIDSELEQTNEVRIMADVCENEDVAESSSDSGLDLMRREACLHKAVSPHAGITKLIAAFEDDECAYLLLELCDDDLYNFIQRGSGPSGSMEGGRGWVSNEVLNNDDNVRRIFDAIIGAVEHVHATGVFHRDLKPENVLLHFNAANQVVDAKSGNSLGFGVKLADFGLATRASFCTDLACGTHGYLPPESLDATLDGYDPRAADVWALGMMLINLRFQCKLWQVADLQEDPYYAQFVASPHQYLERTFPVFSPELVDLLVKVFHPCPSQRAKLADLAAWVQSDMPFTREQEEMDFKDVFESAESVSCTEEPAIPDAAVKVDIDAIKTCKRSAFRYDDDPWWMDSAEEEQLFSPSAATLASQEFGSPSGVAPDSAVSSPLTEEGVQALVQTGSQPIEIAAASAVSNALCPSGMSYSIGSSYANSFVNDNVPSFYPAAAADVQCARADPAKFPVPTFGFDREPLDMESTSAQGSSSSVWGESSTPFSPEPITSPTTPCTMETLPHPSGPNPTPTPAQSTSSSKTTVVVNAFRSLKEQFTGLQSGATLANLGIQAADHLECIDAQLGGLTLELEEALVMGV